jgi:hypothetical protein
MNSYYSKHVNIVHKLKNGYYIYKKNKRIRKIEYR